MDLVGVYDIDENLALEVASKYGNGIAVSAKLDAGDSEAVCIGGAKSRTVSSPGCPRFA